MPERGVIGLIACIDRPTATPTPQAGNGQRQRPRSPSGGRGRFVVDASRVPWSASAASTWPGRGLLTTGFDSWHGLLTEQRSCGPMLTCIVVSAVWTAVCLGVALTV